MFSALPSLLQVSRLLPCRIALAVDRVPLLQNLRSVRLSRACSVCGRRCGGSGRCARHPAAGGYSTGHWRKLRVQALVRDGYRCQLQLDGCTGVATTVHIDPALRGQHEDATLDDCTSACLYCHGVTDAARSVTEDTP